jgi:hypothetical protein
MGNGKCGDDALGDGQREREDVAGYLASLRREPPASIERGPCFQRYGGAIVRR